MRKIQIVIIITLVALASVFTCSAFAESISPWNVILEVEHNGDVMRYDLQQEIAPYLNESEQRGFYLSCQRKQKMIENLVNIGLPKCAAMEYVLPDFGKIFKHFTYVEREKTDAVICFDKSGFSYVQGNDGVAIDVDALLNKALRSCGKINRVTLPLKIDKAQTVSDLKQNAVLKGKFTTSFTNSGENRVHNIRQAANSLNGVTVGVGETFSFNKAVGERSEQNGYKTSKIIQDGNYTDGIGGGVCQVSTTLYNALLLAGFIPQAYQHSLISSYVKAGFDAMVSYGAADLTFTNNTEHPVYIAAAVENKNITFRIYGEPNVYEIKRESVEVRDPFETISIVDSVKYPELVYDDEIKVITNGSDGVKSQSYLNYYQNGKLVLRKLIRQNSYKKVNKVIARGALIRFEDVKGASNALNCESVFPRRSCLTCIARLFALNKRAENINEF